VIESEINKIVEFRKYVSFFDVLLDVSRTTFLLSTSRSTGSRLSLRSKISEASSFLRYRSENPRNIRDISPNNSVQIHTPDHYYRTMGRSLHFVWVECKHCLRKSYDQVFLGHNEHRYNGNHLRIVYIFCLPKTP